jgi:hypothetical protein
MLKVTALITSNVTKHKPFYDFHSIVKWCYFDIPCVRYVSLSASWLHAAVGTAIWRSDAVVNGRLLPVMWFCFVRMSVVSTWLFGRWLILVQGRSDMWQNHFLREILNDLTPHNTVLAICMACFKSAESRSSSEQYSSTQFLLQRKYTAFPLEKSRLRFLQK